MCRVNKTIFLYDFEFVSSITTDNTNKKTSNSNNNYVNNNEDM